VGIEATGAMQWFLELLDELGIECRVGHPVKIRAQERGSRSMIGGMHACCWSCSARIAFRKLPSLSSPAETRTPNLHRATIAH
jgi:hypothetical protein